MRANLAAAFGDRIEAEGRAYYASPTAERLAAAPLEAIRECGVGYRDRYIKALAQAAVEGIDLEAIGRLPRAAARSELVALPGVGPYTADLGLIIGARLRDWMPLDLYIRETLREFYLEGQAASDEELRAFAERTWGPYQGLAALYLTTNTELWVGDAGKTFRLRSGARNPEPGLEG
jgi:N-glycosylase/DNA lyase